MSYPVPDTATSQMVTVGVAEVDFGTPMDVTPRGHAFYEFVSSTNCWIKQGTAPVAATAGAGSKYCHAGERVFIDPLKGVNLSVIQDTAGGKASLTKLRLVR